jgi:hypothetical protein
MNNFICFIIIVVVILFIYYMDHTTEKFNNITNAIANATANATTNAIANEDGDLLTLKPYERCEILGAKKFMVRDLRTKLWLVSGQEEGFSKFLPNNFGVPLLMSTEPNEYLPLRILADPNNYLLSTYDGKGIRVVSNPYNKFFVIQVFIFESSNILGYIDENNKTKYLYVDNNGNITSTKYPQKASVIEIIEL